MAFLRVFLPSLFGDEVRRILYLDVDVAIEQPSPFALFNLNMETHAIACVRDIYMAFSRSAAGDSELAVIDGSRKYRQSGFS